MTITDRVGTLNEQQDIPNDRAEADLRAWLRDSAPELAGLNEWPDSRNVILQRLSKQGYMKWTRPPGHGPAVIYNASRYTLLRCWAHTLVGEGFVGRLPGRKSTLPPSIATVATFMDEERDEKVALVVVHLTAEVQNRHGEYHADRGHALRVRRHKRERRAIRRLVRRLRRRVDRVFVVGDTNYDRMPLRPLISAWEGRRETGTLGGRTVDYVYADEHADHVRTWRGHSDHRAVTAVYR